LIGTHDREAVSMADLWGVSFKLQLFNHNDFTSYGLWTYHIPTLTQFKTMITAQYCLMLSELLARPSDRQLRPFVNITVPNEVILRLRGVRFVVADYALPLRLERLSSPSRGPPVYSEVLSRC
jgi:hypothetical protein